MCLIFELNVWWQNNAVDEQRETSLPSHITYSLLHYCVCKSDVEFSSKLDGRVVCCPWILLLVCSSRHSISSSYLHSYTLDWIPVFVYPLYTNEFFLWFDSIHLGQSKQCIHWGVIGYNFKIKIVHLSKNRLCLSKQCRPRWNAALCGISSGSSLFAIVCIFRCL